MEFDEAEAEEFKIEAFELLDDAESSLLDIESGGSFPDQYFAIFRAFHSLKGASAMLGYDGLQKHMHIMENKLSAYKEKDSIPSELVSYFLTGIDSARKFLSGDESAFDAVDLVAEQDDTETAAPVSQVKETVEQSKGLIYVVDDENQMLELLSVMLGDLGFQTETFDSGEKFLNALQQHEPDMVLCDQQMPKMSGIELFQNVHESNHDLPFVFHTAHMEKQLIVELLKSGVYAIIEKPAEENELELVCSRAIKTRKILQMVEESMNLLMYQFTDVEACMKQMGRNDTLEAMRTRIENLVQLRREIKSIDRHLIDEK